MVLTIDFLRPFVIDHTILNWEGLKYGSDLTKKVLEVMNFMREDPSLVTSKHLKAIIYDKDSQICEDHKDARYKHFQNAAYISRELTEKLGSIHPDLDLYSPSTAWSLGLLHDISNVYVKSKRIFDHVEKELPLFFHANYLGIPLLAKAAMYHGYFGILNMLCEGTGFAQDPLYADWTEALQNPDYPLNYSSIMQNFSGFLKGEGDLGLIILTLADNLDDTTDPKSNGKIDFNKMAEPFKRRMDDIIYRYFTAKIKQRISPAPLGISLNEMGERARIESYLFMIDDLLHNRNMHLYDKNARPGLWKR